MAFSTIEARKDRSRQLPEGKKEPTVSVLIPVRHSRLRVETTNERRMASMHRHRPIDRRNPHYGGPVAELNPAMFVIPSLSPLRTDRTRAKERRMVFGFQHHAGLVTRR